MRNLPTDIQHVNTNLALQQMIQIMSIAFVKKLWLLQLFLLYAIKIKIILHTLS